MKPLVAVAIASLFLLEPPRFTAVQPDLLGTGGNLVNAWADYDGDGDVDLFVGFNGVANRLYRNDAGTLVDAAAATGVADARATRAGAWGDYDGDGDPDLLVGFAPGPQSVLKLYRNDAGKFTDVTAAVGVARDSGAVRQLSFVDTDGDGDVDLFVAFRDRPNVMFRNDAGKFADVAADIGLADRRKSVGAVWFDFDEDGDFDLYLANMDGDANALYRNDAGKFTDVAAERGIAWGGRLPNDSTNVTVRPCAADVNGDGHIDIVTANYGRRGLFLNRGGGKFEDASAAWGLDIESHDDACALADFDNDGRLDMYVNGTVTGGVSYRDYLYRNTGTKTVAKFGSAEVVRDADGAPMFLDRQNIPAIVDLDCDGRLDFFIGRIEGHVARYEAIAPGADRFGLIEDHYEGIEIIGRGGTPPPVGTQVRGTQYAGTRSGLRAILP